MPKESVATANTDYQALLDEVPRLDTGSLDQRADAYHRLMQKETRVLETVDRVVNQMRHDVVEKSTFLNMSLTEIFVRTMHVLQNVLDELLHIRKPMDIVYVLWDGDRKIYMGILLIAIAFAVFFAHTAAQ